ncbi:MAG: S9 family peptidase [Candidatus Zixiibacteriota bacterium]
MRKGFWAVVLIGVLSVVAPASAQMFDSAYVPDIETFMQIGGNYGPQVSEDGSVLCFTSSMSGVNQLYRLTDKGWPMQVTVFTDGIDFYSLSHNGKWAIVGAAVGGSEQTNLYLVEVRTGVVKALTDLDGVQIADPTWTYDDSKIFYRSNEANGTDFYVYEMDVKTGQSRPILTEAGYNGPWVVSKDGKWLVTYLFSSNVDNDLHLVNLSDLTFEKLTPHEGNANYYAVDFSDDMKSLYILSNANEDGIARRAKLDIASKKIEFLESGTVWETEEFEISPEGKTMAWVVNEEGYARLHLADMATGAELPVPPLDGIIGNVSFSSPDEIIFTFTGPANPPDCWKWNFRTKDLTQWTFAISAGVDLDLLVQPELVHIPSIEDVQIGAYLYLPPGAKKGDKVPFIVYAHGGPESQFRPTFIRNFQYFALNGFGILAVNPRGSAGYGQEFLDMDNYKNRWKSVKDYEMATRWIIDQGYADPAHIGVTGGSYGGYMTLACITANPDLYAAAIDIVGIANFVTFLKNTADYRRHLRESEYGPLTDSAYLYEISPVANVDKIKAPLMIIHGENDPRVPVGEARQMAEAISAQGGIVDTLIFPDEGHGVAKRSNMLIQYRRMVDFFKEHLKDEKPLMEQTGG